MKADSADVAWLDARCTIDQSALAQACGLTVAEIDELVDYGLLAPLGGTPPSRLFSAACVDPLRQAGVLRERFDLDVFVLGILSSQFERIARLEQQVHSLQAHVLHAEPARDGPATWREPHD